jgi:hypothetical protein
MYFINNCSAFVGLTISSAEFIECDSGLDTAG